MQVKAGECDSNIAGLVWPCNFVKKCIGKKKWLCIKSNLKSDWSYQLVRNGHGYCGLLFHYDLQDSLWETRIGGISD